MIAVTARRGAQSFDHLIGTRQQSRRQDEAKTGGRLQVQGKLEPGRPLKGQRTRIAPLRILSSSEA